MGQQVVWTEPAQADLVAIYEYVQRDSVQYANFLAVELTKASDSLSEFPRRGRRFPESRTSDEIRELFVEPYRMIYRIGAERVEIIAVIHMSRDVSQFGSLD
jgi:toxin ParE1/3/4